MSVLEDLRDIENRLAARMRELRPLVEEYRELEAFAQRLGINVDEAPPARTTAASASAKQRRAGTRTSGRRAKRTMAPKGQRQQQMIELLRDRPGITVRDIGKEIGVDPTSLYRIVRALEREGTITKQGSELRLAH
jgi:CRP-like cAMP-binding protein